MRDYHGTQLQTSLDLKTNACCTTDIPAAHRKILATLESEVLEKYYGCGVAVPDNIAGCTVLDLGSGSGRDASLLSKLVGERSRVASLHGGWLGMAAMPHWSYTGAAGALPLHRP